MGFVGIVSIVIMVGAFLGSRAICFFGGAAILASLYI